MLSKDDVVAAARGFGFDDIGFTSPEPFLSQEKLLTERKDRYAWATQAGLDLIAGSAPLTIMPQAKTIIVLIKNYHSHAFPPSLTGLFGRCYLDDDRVTKDGLSRQIKKFRQFLSDKQIESKIPINLPHRLAAARAGLGNFGKNCLFYARRAARGSSWVVPIALMIDREFSYDEPSIRVGCPDWCRNVCLAACPTGALKSPGEIDPGRCISYLTYYGNELTPLKLREPMGMWVYGCDRCQEVCPRNAPWLNQLLPMNERVAAKAENFDLISLLQMDLTFFETKVWPHMFYMNSQDLWRWQMNAARAMGNSGDKIYLPCLEQAFANNGSDNVRAMAAWSIGKIGGKTARAILEKGRPAAQGRLLQEIDAALGLAE